MAKKAVEVAIAFKNTLTNAEKASNKLAKMRAYRAEARRKVSLANKRIRRLEEKGLQESPAYKALVKNGEPRFSIRGKDFNQLQKEVARMDKFIEYKTSTLTGVKENVQNIANTIGITNTNPKQLLAEAGKFFELASKTEQYLNQVNSISANMGYQKIWEAINQYVVKEKKTLSEATQDIDDLIEQIAGMVIETEAEEAEKAYLAEDTDWFIP